MIAFRVDAVPVSQPRPRSIVQNGKLLVFSAKKEHPVNAFKATVRLAAAQEYSGPPLDTPVKLHVMFVLPRPAKRDGRKHKNDDRYWHTKKPDLDNLEKSVKDALTGLIWKDDSQVCAAQKTKVVASDSESPHVFVRIEQL